MSARAPRPRPPRLLGLLMLAAALAAACASAPRPPSQAATPRQPSATATPALSARPHTVMLIGMGDSITDGFGAEPGRGYFDQVEERLRKRYPELKARNLSVSGTTSGQHLQRQLPALEVQPADCTGIVLLTTGGNDLIHNYGRTPPQPDAMYGATLAQARPWIAAYRQRLNQLLDGLEQRFPGGCCVFLGNLYDPTDGEGDVENAGLDLPRWPELLAVHKAMNLTMAEVAEERPRVYLVDLHAGMKDHGIHHREDYWYFDNLEDPNQKGYDAITELFWTAIEQTDLASPSGSGS